MSILTGDLIVDQVGQDRITIDPFDETAVGANSVDLRLADVMLGYDVGKDLDMRKDNPTYKIGIGSNGILLMPGRLYLASTVEVCGSDYFVPCIEGRSSLARLGLSVHASAGVGDIGWKGTFTLEMTVVHPLRIYAGERICQVLFYTAVGGLSRKYKGKYQDQSGPVASRMWMEGRS